MYDRNIYASLVIGEVIQKNRQQCTY